MYNFSWGMGDVACWNLVSRHPMWNSWWNGLSDLNMWKTLVIGFHEDIRSIVLMWRLSLSRGLCLMHVNLLPIHDTYFTVYSIGENFLCFRMKSDICYNFTYRWRDWEHCMNSQGSIIASIKYFAHATDLPWCLEYCILKYFNMTPLCFLQSHEIISLHLKKFLKTIAMHTWSNYRNDQNHDSVHARMDCASTNPLTTNDEENVIKLRIPTYRRSELWIPSNLHSKHFSLLPKPRHHL